MGKKKKKSKPQSTTQPKKNQPRNPIPPGILYAALAVVAVTVLIYSNSLTGPFIFDDETNITNNPSIHHLWPLWNTFFSPPETSTAGRPVVNFTFALNYALSGENVWSYHALNVLIQALAALTLFGIVRRTLLSEPLRDRYAPVSTGLALAGALIWLAHPLQTQAVTYISQRCESLMGLFLFLTLYCAIRGWQADSSRGWHRVAIVACLLGVGSKESIIAAPFLVFAYDLVFVNRQAGNALRRSKELYAGLVLCLISLGLLVAAGGTLSGTARSPFTPLEYAQSQPQVIFHYLRLAFWPDSLTLDYGWKAASFGSALPYTLGLFVLAAVSGWALLKRRPVGFAALWFFATLAPTSSILPLRDLAFEYRMYLPLAGLAVMAAVAGYEAIRWILKRHRATDETEIKGLIPSETGIKGLIPAGIGTLIAVVALLGLLTFLRNADYQSGYSIWNDTVQKQPNNSRAHTNLGYALLQSGAPQEAIPHFQKALKHNPKNARAMNNLGLAQGKSGKPQMAVPWLQEAVRIEPGNAGYHYNLGFTFTRLGEAEKAIPHLEKSLELNPDNGQAHNLLGQVLSSAGRSNEAISHLTKALQQNPNSVKALNNLGYALMRIGKSKEAILPIRKSLKLNPKNASAHYNLGYSLFYLRKYQEAIPSFKEAVRLKPDYPEAHNELGKMLIQVGHPEESIPYFKKAIALKPDYAEAYNYYGIALGKVDRILEAIVQIKEAVRLDPDNVKAHNNLGLAYGFARKTKEAVPHFKTALRLDPNFAEAHFNLGIALGKLNYIEPAIEHFQVAVNIKPNYTAAKNNLKQLREILAQIEEEKQRAKELEEKRLNDPEGFDENQDF